MSGVLGRISAQQNFGFPYTSSPVDSLRAQVTVFWRNVVLRGTPRGLQQDTSGPYCLCQSAIYMRQQAATVPARCAFE